MGIDASAELIWGIPVSAYDDDGLPSALWDEENEDWREFDGCIHIEMYGHYESDCPLGILTTSRVGTVSGNCYSPTDIGDLTVSDKAFSKANDSARAAGLDVDFYTDAKWWLVAGMG